MYDDQQQRNQRTPIAPQPLFELGTLTVAPEAEAALNEQGFHEATLLARHRFGDYGDLDEEESRRNDELCRSAGKVLSVYPLPGGEVVVMVVTDCWNKTTEVSLAEPR